MKFETFPSEQVITVLDSSGNLVREIRQHDTVHTLRGETCVWERGPLGYPYLRCYPRYYPREWYRYNKSPWWYRSDEHLYSADRCPPYYYYDEACGCCRYYLHNPGLKRERSVSPATVATPTASTETTGRIPSRSSDTNVKVSATTHYSRSVSPKTLFQNSGSTVTPAAAVKTSTSSPPQKTDSLARAGDSSGTRANRTDSAKSDSGAAGAIRVAPAPDTSSPPAPPPVPKRERRTMRSW